MTRLNYPFHEVLLWIFCLAWLLTIYPQGHEPNSENNTTQLLANHHSVIEDFKATWNDLPHSITELAAFAKASGRRFSFFDGHGQALEYLRLSKDHFILRSFGKDGVQNVLFRALDPGISELGKIPASTAIFANQSNDPLDQWGLYPAELLLGSDSPNGEWHARIYSDPSTSQRKLLVRHKEKPLFLTAHHDFVEEFLWLPHSYSLVFTAGATNRYAGGIFIWNIANDTTWLLSNQFKDEALRETSQISLSSVSRLGDRLFFFANSQSGETQPALLSFFSSDNAYELTFDAEKHLVLNVEKTKTQFSFNDLDLKPGQRILTKDKTLQSQKQWAELPVSGSIGQVLEAWQKFSVDHAESLILPYCLIYLGLFYEKFANLTKDKSKGAQALTYAYLLLDSLSKNPIHPSYLRWISFDLSTRLAREDLLLGLTHFNIYE